MIKIALPDIVLTGDQAAKQQAATQQIKALLANINTWVKYRVLTHNDREHLIQQGFARDLVDNLVYLTQRYAANPAEQDDHFVTGFTNAAFDPSIYACDTIKHTLAQATGGNCCWCESQIAPNNAIVSHYRPPYGYTENNILYRNTYTDLAYEFNNLIYACTACANDYKRDHFPITGQRRTTATTLGQENPSIINPYTEDPRQFIRFNPTTGLAYPYDQVLAFYQDTKNQPADKTQKLLWQSPSKIPHYPHQPANTPLTNTDHAFKQWQQKQAQDRHPRGITTIQTLGLNRSSLQRARISHLQQLRGLFLAQMNTVTTPTGESQTLTNMLTELQQPTNFSLTANSYRSLTIDALNTWAAEKITNNKNPPPDWLALYKKQQQQLNSVPDNNLSPALISELLYIVLENELSLANKRRIICLNADDLLYSSVNTKCVFLGIDWQHDLTNPIKVNAGKHIWQTSFNELAETRPNALRSLFAHNELWAEGYYQPLDAA